MQTRSKAQEMGLSTTAQPCQLQAASSLSQRWYCQSLGPVSVPPQPLQRPRTYLTAQQCKKSLGRP